MYINYFFRLQSLTLFVVLLFSGSTVQSATTITYIYDDLNRIENVGRSDGPSLSYTYDEVGNITVSTSSNPDIDGDLLTDIQEIVFGLDPNSSDTDGDSLTDYFEVCFDGDCTTYRPYPSGNDLDATVQDTDGDGVNDNIEIALETNPLDAISFPILADGDLNEDGIVNVVDILLANQIINGEIVPTATQLLHGDVAPLISGVPQPNGTFNVGDLLLIQRKALGLIDF